MQKLGLSFMLMFTLLPCLPIVGQTWEEKIQQATVELQWKKWHIEEEPTIEAKTENSEPKEAVPQDSPKEIVETIPLVNILLVDGYGRVQDCFKGVRVSDISLNGKSTGFLFENKPISWNQKVIFSYQYVENETSVTGAIYYTPEGGATVSVINIPPYNVYQDANGEIRYDALNGCFPIAPKGSGYITTQCVLPTQK